MEQDNSLSLQAFKAYRVKKEGERRSTLKGTLWTVMSTAGEVNRNEKVRPEFGSSALTWDFHFAINQFHLWLCLMRVGSARWRKKWVFEANKGWEGISREQWKFLSFLLSQTFLFNLYSSVHTPPFKVHVPVAGPFHSFVNSFGNWLSFNFVLVFICSTFWLSVLCCWNWPPAAACSSIVCLKREGHEQRDCWAAGIETSSHNVSNLRIYCTCSKTFLLSCVSITKAK